MKQRVKLVIVIPVGAISSNNRYEHMIDTIESIQHYTASDYQLVIQDNSSPLHLGERLRQTFPNITVVRAPKNYGLFGGLYKSLSLALLHIHAAYDFDVLIKMDTDALMIGEGIADDAIRYFEEHPETGMLGNFLDEGEGIAWPRERLRFETSTLGWLLDRKRCATLRLYRQMARSSGYQDGEHILGGAAIYSPVFIDRLVKGDFLLREELRRSKLQEDHLWGLLCRAVGMEQHRFHLPERPMAVVWKGLPDAPKVLRENGAKIIHSTRYWNDMNEERIRAFFRAYRKREYRQGA